MGFRRKSKANSELLNPLTTGFIDVACNDKSLSLYFHGQVVNHGALSLSYDQQQKAFLGRLGTLDFQLRCVRNGKHRVWGLQVDAMQGMSVVTRKVFMTAMQDGNALILSGAFHHPATNEQYSIYLVNQYPFPSQSAAEEYFDLQQQDQLV